MAEYRLLDDPSAVLRTTDAQVIHSNPAAPSADWRAYQNWLAAGNTADPIAVVARSPHILVSDYLARFTNAEMDAINTFALTAPPTAQSLAVFKFITQNPASARVDLTSARITAAHTLMVNRGFLTSARSAAILTP